MLFTSSVQKSINLAVFVIFFCPSWTTSRERSRSAERTGCGGTCPRCRFASANKSSAFSLAPSSFLRTSRCYARPGRTVAPGRNGSSNRYVLLVHRQTNHWQKNHGLNELCFGFIGNKTSAGVELQTWQKVIFMLSCKDGLFICMLFFGFSCLITRCSF